MAARGRSLAPTPADALRALHDAETGLRTRPFGSAWPIALAYANTYHVGMSSLGFQALYARLNSRDDILCERIFWDAAHPGGLSDRHRRPQRAEGAMDMAGSEESDPATPGWPTHPPLSVESRRSLREFPIVAFSIAFEMDYLNLVDMLIRSGLDPWAARRQSGDPLIVVGGSAVTMNRLPIYDFVDVVVHGDGETAVDELATLLNSHGPGRDALRAALRGRPGFEVTDPRDPDDSGADNRPPVPIPRLSLAERITEFDTRSHIFTPHTEFATRGLVELSRGCPYKCTFCIMGYQPFRYRWRSPAEIEAMAREILPYTNRIGLVASAVGIHPEIEDICARLRALGTDISFSSLRVEDVKPAMVDALLASGQRTLTIAPEVGNEPFRIRLRKRLSDERIETFASDTIARGMQHLKLYFMVGLPGETDEDVRSIADLTGRLHRRHVDASRAHGRLGHLALNVGVFVPKPGTPLGDGGFAGIAEGRRRLKLLQGELKRLPNLKVHFSNPNLAAAQAILSRGGRDAADFLFWTWQHARGDWRRAVSQFPELLEECSAPG